MKIFLDRFLNSGTSEVDEFQAHWYRWNKLTWILQIHCCNDPSSEIRLLSVYYHNFFLLRNYCLVMGNRCPILLFNCFQKQEWGPKRAALPCQFEQDQHCCNKFSRPDTRTVRSGGTIENSGDLENPQNDETIIIQFRCRKGQHDDETNPWWFTRRQHKHQMHV
jgi:hypothetical protein